MNFKKIVALLLSLTCVWASPSWAGKGVPPPTATATLTASPNPAGVNQVVVLQATVSPPTATGTVTFNDGSTTLGTANVSANGLASLATSFSATGPHSLTAVYSGNASFASATSNTVTESVSATVTTTPTSVSLQPNLGLGNTVSVDSPFELDAWVLPNTATGTVTFMQGSTTLGVATVGVTGGAAIYPSFHTVGTYNLTAIYSGDSTYAGSISPVLALTVTTIPTRTSQQITTGSGTAYASAGQSLTIASYVNQSGGTVPGAGTLSVYDGSTLIGTSPLSPSNCGPNTGGCYKFSYTPTTTGDHSITATYSGDSATNFAASTSVPTDITVLQGTIPTLLQVSLTAAGPYYVNAPVAVSAAVQPGAPSVVGASNGVNFGTVTLKDGTTTVGTITINSNSVGEYAGTGTIKLASSGTRSLTASYSGGYDFLGSSLTSAIPVVVSAPGASTTTIAATSNPAAVNQTFNLTALVTGSGPTATGTVTFSDAGSRKSGAVTLGAVNLVGGMATLPVSFAATGTHSISASYSGDGANAASTSGALSLKVDTNPATSVSLNAAPNPVAVGEPLVLSASTSGIAAGSAISFSDGSTTLGTANVTNGQASLTTTLAASGVHYLTASYAGSRKTNAAQSATVAVQVGSSAASTSPGVMTWLYSYDASDNLTGIVDPNGNATSLGYDVRNNNTQTTLPAADARTASPVVTKQFDMQGNVVSLTDPRNNATSYTYNGVTPVPVSTTSPDSGASSVTFDANRNITSMTDARGKTKTLAYDALGRLTSITYASGTPTTFEYDGGANPAPFSAGRLTKIADESGTTNYAYDVYEHVTAKNVTVGNLTFGVALMKQTGSATVGNIAVIVYNIYADQLGTPRMITRQADSAVVWRWDAAEAYGATGPDQNPSGLGMFVFDQRFPGQVFDAETGNFQNWNREYSARSGRYLESDPIGLSGGLNAFAYVRGNPLAAVDPLGLYCLSEAQIAAISGAAGLAGGATLAEFGPAGIAVGAVLGGIAGGVYGYITTTTLGIQTGVGAAVGAATALNGPVSGAIGGIAGGAVAYAGQKAGLPESVNLPLAG